MGTAGNAVSAIIDSDTHYTYLIGDGEPCCRIPDLTCLIAGMRSFQLVLYVCGYDRMRFTFSSVKTAVVGRIFGPKLRCFGIDSDRIPWFHTFTSV